MENKEVAERLYTRYREYTQGRSLATGAEIPEWADMKPEIQMGWCHVADEVGKICTELIDISTEKVMRERQWR